MFPMDLTKTFLSLSDFFERISCLRTNIVIVKVLGPAWRLYTKLVCFYIGFLRGNLMSPYYKSLFEWINSKITVGLCHSDN